MNNPKMLQALRISTFAAIAALNVGCASTAPEDGADRAFAPGDNATLSYGATMPLAEGTVCVSTDAFAPEFVDDPVPLKADDNVYIEVLGAFACEVEHIDNRIVVRPERDADSFEDVARCKLGALENGTYEIEVEGIDGARFPLEVPSRPDACLPAPARADRMASDLKGAAASPGPVALDRPGLDHELSAEAEVEIGR